MGGSNGLDVLKTAKALHPSTSVILMTAFGSVSTAVDAMKAGAFDYVQKPFEIEEMGGQDQQGARDAPHAASDRLPPPRARRHLRFRPLHWLERRARKGAWRRPQGSQEQYHRPRPRRDRHRQGINCERRSSQLQPRDSQFHQSQLRGAAGKPAGIGTLRPREGGVHRRRQAADRPLRTSRRGHAVPGRDRRHERQHTGEDPARPARARIRTAGRHAYHQGGRPADRGHEPRPDGDGGVGRLPSARTCTTGSTSSRSECRRSASGRRMWQRSQDSSSSASQAT